MRVIDEIPHERFKIQIFNYNSKYIVKVELGQFEQSYKIGELDVMGLDDVKSMVDREFLKGCLQRFISMREDWEHSFRNKNTDQEEV
ncbi:MAG: hypothetical protein ACQERC_07440 [Bacteroidota bacterium]